MNQEKLPGTGTCDTRTPNGLLEAAAQVPHSAVPSVKSQDGGTVGETNQSVSRV